MSTVSSTENDTSTEAQSADQAPQDTLAAETLADRVAALEQRVAKISRDADLMKRRRRFALTALILPLIGLRVIGQAAGFGEAAKPGWVEAAGAALLIAWLLTVMVIGGRRREIADWPFFRFFRRIAGVATVVLGAWLFSTLLTALRGG